MTDKPSVLFVCVHNAGRSQMAAGFLTHLAGDRIEVRSAGSTPADAVNPVAVEAMREVGIDISAETPKLLTLDAVKASDVCVTMGCGDTCPVFPGKRYLDWTPGRPGWAGYRRRCARSATRSRQRVRALIDELLPEGAE
jgi:arsenate reductase